MTKHTLKKVSPIQITDAAVSEIIEIYKNKGIPADYFLRVGTSGGGCSGVTYIIGFDKKGDNDELYEIKGIEVIISKKHALFLWGVEVDFLDNDERGFKFNTGIN